jgi:predicted nucleotidyltransferase
MSQQSREQELAIIRQIINKYFDPKQNQVFVFGSLATGDEFRGSDYDIGVEGKEIEPRTYFTVLDEFEQSDLHRTVDLVDFNDVSADFKNIAKQKIIPINYEE